MQFKAEYQLSSNNTEIKYTQEAFLKLLSCDSNLKVDTDGTISFDEVKASLSLVSARSNDGKSHIYVCTTTVEASCEQIDLVSKLLRRIRKIMETISTSLTVLWDDVSFHACKIAYEIIYVLENKMRKLVNTFMIHVAGANWVDRSIHPDIKAIMKKAGEERKRSELFALDFSHLSLLIFRPYANSDFHSNVDKLANALSKPDLSTLKEIVSDLIPRSNWERHFVNIIRCEPKQLEEDWEELYELRCKVAHNADFALNDLKKLRVLERRVSSVLDDAIKKVQEIKVSPTTTSEILQNAKSIVASSVILPENVDIDSTSVVSSRNVLKHYKNALEKLDISSLTSLSALQIYAELLAHSKNSKTQISLENESRD